MSLEFKLGDRVRLSQAFLQLGKVFNLRFTTSTGVISKVQPLHEYWEGWQSVNETVYTVKWDNDTFTPSGRVSADLQLAESAKLAGFAAVDTE